MSDRVTNFEVEDVLSSIRRLVSDDKRPKALRGSDAALDRLVLTPSLRVEAQESQKTKIQAPDGEGSGSAGLEAVDGAAGAVSHSALDQFEFGSDLPVPADRHVSADAAEASSDADPEIQQSYGGSVPGAAPERRTGRVTPQDTAPDQPEETDDASRDAEERSFSVSSLATKIAALETAIGRIPETWEPDDTGADDYSGTDAPRIDWKDQVDLESTGIPRDTADRRTGGHDRPIAPAARPNRPEAEMAALDEHLIDEDMLRDLVAEIVRSELQGALGERITRNVRKLVRREIQRALAAQELE